MQSVLPSSSSSFFFFFIVGAVWTSFICAPPADALLQQAAYNSPASTSAMQNDMSITTPLNSSASGQHQFPGTRNLSATVPELQHSLHFIKNTLQYSLETFGGDTYKRMQADVNIQQQLHALADSVTAQLHEIERDDHEDTFGGGLGDSESLSVHQHHTTSDASHPIVDQLQFHHQFQDTDYDPAARRTQHALNLVTATISHVLQMHSPSHPLPQLPASFHSSLDRISTSISQQLSSILLKTQRHQRTQTSDVFKADEGRVRHAFEILIIIQVFICIILVPTYILFFLTRALIP